MSALEPLRIVHVFRAPVGGLFRHVRDLCATQAAAGHQVGVICADRGDERSDALLTDLSRHLNLGLHRIPMVRTPGVADLQAIAATRGVIHELDPDVVHGHGAKGGLCARLAPGRRGRIMAYTPHGGSLADRNLSPASKIYAVVERILALRTDVFLFESQFVSSVFAQIGGKLDERAKVIHNGVSLDELAPVSPRPDAADFVFLGELRFVKGVDVLLCALADIRDALGEEPSAVIVGSGPLELELKHQAEMLGLRKVRFAGSLPTREALSLGRTLVLPSRQESLPYVILEAIAASVPVVATAAGGIAEIFRDDAHRLVECGNPVALKQALLLALQEHPDERRARADRLLKRVSRRFTLDGMAAGVEAGYRWALGQQGRGPARVGMRLAEIR